MNLPADTKTTVPAMPPVTDPDKISELLCEGPFNIAVMSTGIAVLTFTHRVPDSALMFKDGTLKETAVVRARIAMTVASLKNMRDALNGMKI